MQRKRQPAKAEISQPVASRDLQLLVESGLLIPAGEKRGRLYIASDLLKALRQRTLEPNPNYRPALP